MLFLKSYQNVNCCKCSWLQKLEISKKYLSTNTYLYFPVETKLVNNNETEKSTTKDKLLFNSVLNAKNPRLGFFKARRLYAQQQELKHLIQPLPLSLKFLSDDLLTEKVTDKVQEQQISESNKNVQFPYSSVSSPVSEFKTEIKNEDLQEYSPETIDKEVRAKNNELRRWMNAYDNLERDIVEDGEDGTINYGTPDPKSVISDVPCGGCGALLHCKVRKSCRVMMYLFEIRYFLDHKYFVTIRPFSFHTYMLINILILIFYHILFLGDVYLVGCTNVGKSSLFNALLGSDYCKIQAADLIQRATTSQWPGTTLNLLKFPIMKLSSHRLYLRNLRLTEMNKSTFVEENRRREQLKAHNVAENATLIGRIEQTFSKYTKYSRLPEKADSFSAQTQPNNSGRTTMGVNENHPDYASGRWCYDTPGVVHPDQILDLLTLEELILTLPKELIRPETFCVKPGTSLFIAGLARLDYLKGPDSIKLTVFRSNELPITICDLNRADQTYEDCLGSELFKVPIDEGDRLSKWPGLSKGKPFTVTGVTRRLSINDVVLSNAGWISITCSGNQEYTLQAWTPEKRGIHLRDSILPKTVTLRGKRIKYTVQYEGHTFI
uniref:Nitric oxide-associated protein 1-like n=1 Tax=Diabrotica virgifera virgifera TaxID=50390 RepID=A0A6P7GYS2_DIAVI